MSEEVKPESTTETPESNTLDSQPSGGSSTGDTSTGQSGTGESSEQNPESFTKFDLNAVDEKLRPEVEKAYKSFQGDYTRKTQGLAEDRRRYEAEVATLKREMAQIQAVATTVLKDPKQYDAYRSLYGPQLGIKPEAEPKPIETTEDLLNLIQEKTKHVEAQAEARVDAKMRVYESQLRWDAALQDTRKDPVFQKYEDLIVQMVQDQRKPYLAQYRAGQLSEKDVLSKGLEELRGIIRQEREDGKAEGLGVNAAKKKAQTAMPGRAMDTTPAKTLTKDEIIARVRSKVGY